MRPNEVISILQKVGYCVDHQTGSHVILYKESRLPVSVPFHNRDLKKGTLHHIVRSTGLSIDEFLRLR
jgi:predicted RNA binding protein YcfA (HicA-like mRNA interferase family)